MNKKFLIFLILVLMIAGFVYTVVERNGGAVPDETDITEMSTEIDDDHAAVFTDDEADAETGENGEEQENDDDTF